GLGGSPSGATGSPSTAGRREGRSCTTFIFTSRPAGGTSGRSSDDDSEDSAVSVQFRPERVALDNGLGVVLQPHDAADVAAVQLWVRAGARDERADEAGLSHFI